MSATTSIKFTRADYMAKRCTHREYYGQFVSQYVRDLVRDRVGMARLLSSRDEHLNDIPLSVWDSFWVRHADGGMYIQLPFAVVSLIKEAGEDFSASTGTCILKEAARQVIEQEDAR